MTASIDKPMDYNTTATLIMLPNAALQHMFKLGAIDAKVTNKGRTLIGAPCHSYSNFRSLLENGCPLISMDDNKCLTMPNRDYLHALLRNSIPEIDCSVVDYLGENILFKYISDANILMSLLNARLVHFNPNHQNTKGNTLLHEVCDKNFNLDIVVKLGKLGAETNVTNKKFQSATYLYNHNAISIGHLIAVTLFCLFIGMFLGIAIRVKPQ